MGNREHAGVMNHPQGTEEEGQAVGSGEQKPGPSQEGSVEFQWFRVMLRHTVSRAILAKGRSERYQGSQEHRGMRRDG